MTKASAEDVIVISRDRFAEIYGPYLPESIKQVWVCGTLVILDSDVELERLGRL